ncbi:MAG TPA: hypothetical protein VLB76_16575 [Thermoanaerobaculia bacterium]|jgi:hypothetical protein|nr:hypothetical protein [Thermoanaerobaculia bacterium]
MVIGRWRLPLLLLPFAGGLGLVMHILVDLSLPLAVAALVSMGALLWFWFARRVPIQERRRMRRRARVGLLTGLLATVAYDAVRYGVVALWSFSFEPFHVIPIFGHLFVGAAASEAWAWAAGLAYHVGNGTGFGIAYVLLFRQPGPLTGVAWGLGLELAMALLYPSWLRLTALGEFLTVSMIGHLTYGCVLGLAARRYAAGEPSHAPSGR